MNRASAFLAAQARDASERAAEPPASIATPTKNSLMPSRTPIAQAPERGYWRQMSTASSSDTRPQKISKPPPLPRRPAPTTISTTPSSRKYAASTRVMTAEPNSGLASIATPHSSVSDPMAKDHKPRPTLPERKAQTMRSAPEMDTSTPSSRMIEKPVNAGAS